MRNKLTDVCQKMLDLLEHAQHYYTGPHKDEFGVIHEARALLAAQPAEPAPSDMGQDDISGDCPHDTCDPAACQCAEPARVDRQGVALSDAELEDIYGWKGYTLDRFKREVRAILSRASSSRAEVEIPAVCDGKEQEAFEAWAKSERHDMNQHPMFYFFLDEKTNAARQGWKGAIEYCGNMLAAAEAPNGDQS